MQLRQLLELTKKWFWLIVLAAVIGGAAGLAVDHFLPKKYQASATVFVSSPNHTDYTSLLGAQQAAKAFASFPPSQPILSAALQKVGDTGLSEMQLATMVTVQNDLDSQYVTIMVTDSDPVLAAKLASTIARLSIDQFQATVANPPSTKALTNELASLQKEIYDLTQEQNTLLSQPPSLDPAVQAGRDAKLAAVSNQLIADKNLLYQYQAQNITIQSELSSIQVSLLQDARVPDKPVGPGAPISLAIGLLIGLIAIVGVIIIIEQTDDVLRTPSKVNKVSGLTTLLTLKRLPSTINQLPWLKSFEPGQGVVVTVKPVKALAQRAGSTEHKSLEDETPSQKMALVQGKAPSKVSMNGRGNHASRFELPESFLALGVLLNSEIDYEQHALERRGRTLLVTSPENGDGKTLVAAQLALGLARVGVKVVLVDTNLRRPQIHKIFGVTNRTGLSSILYTDKIRDMNGDLVDTLQHVLQPTPEPNLAILPTGPVVDAAPALLSSNRMAEILNRLSQDTFVVIDSPAVLTTSEAMILASKSDDILMVVDAQRTTASRLNQSLGMLSHLHAPVRGVVLNQVLKSDLN